jgi:hypothetical protein
MSQNYPTDDFVDQPAFLFRNIAYWTHDVPIEMFRQAVVAVTYSVIYDHALRITRFLYRYYKNYKTRYWKWTSFRPQVRGGRYLLCRVP